MLHAYGEGRILLVCGTSGKACVCCAFDVRSPSLLSEEAKNEWGFDEFFVFATARNSVVSRDL